LTRVCYIAAKKQECPLTLTRFREEHYDTKAHRAWVKIQGAGDPGNPYVESPGTASHGAERRALRSLYFKEKGTKPASPKQRRLEWQDQGFG